MKIKDCFKEFNDRAVSKTIPPFQTSKIALKKLRKISPPIYKEHFFIKRPSRIPQYRVIGTQRFMITTSRSGANGKGHSRKQALASGLMEFIERYSCEKYFLAKIPVLASFNELHNNLYQFEDLSSHFISPESMQLLADSQVKNAKIRWYSGHTLKGEPAYLPIPLLRFMVQGTNGMAAGNSLEEALLHGICEVVERHAKVLIEAKRLKTPSIDISTIDSPAARKLICRLQSVSRKLYINNFSLAFGLPIISVIRQITQDKYAITAGVATSRNEALVRALAENSQSEGSEDSQRRPSSLKHILSYKKIIPWDSVPDIYNKNIKIELQLIEKLLARQGMKIFFINTTDRILRIPSVLVVISGAKMFERRNVLGGLIEEYIDFEKYQAAKQLLDIAEKTDKGNRLFYDIKKAILLRRHSQYKEAIELFTRYINARKNNLSAREADELRKISLVNLAICNLALKRHDKAVDCCSQLLNIDYNFTFAPLRYIYENNRLLAKDIPLLNKAETIFEKVKLFYIYKMLHQRNITRRKRGDR